MTKIEAIIELFSFSEKHGNGLVYVRQPGESPNFIHISATSVGKDQTTMVVPALLADLADWPAIIWGDEHGSSTPVSLPLGQAMQSGAAQVNLCHPGD
jgi:hypothetical protein